MLTKLCTSHSTQEAFKKDLQGAKHGRTVEKPYATACLQDVLSMVHRHSCNDAAIEVISLWIQWCYHTCTLQTPLKQLGDTF